MMTALLSAQYVKTVNFERMIGNFDALTMLACANEVISDGCNTPSASLRSAMLIGLTADRTTFYHDRGAFDVAYFLNDPVFLAIPKFARIQEKIQALASSTINFEESPDLRQPVLKIHRDICAIVDEARTRLQRVNCLRENTLRKRTEKDEQQIPMFNEYDQMKHSIDASGIDGIWTDPGFGATDVYCPNDPEQLTDAEIRAFHLLS